MVVPHIEFDPSFEKSLRKIKDGAMKERVRKQVEKIIDDPEVGKSMMYARKGTREVYIPPFRLSYSYTPEDSRVTFLELYHKDEQ